jgi:hypothetical protein
MQVPRTQPTITQNQLDTVLEVLHQGYRAIRAAARVGDLAKCEVLSNALYALPNLLAKGDHPGTSLKPYATVRLRFMGKDYPEVKRWSVVLLEHPPLST